MLVRRCDCCKEDIKDDDCENTFWARRRYQPNDVRVDLCDDCLDIIMTLLNKKED